MTGGIKSMMTLPNSSCKSPNALASCLRPPVPALAAASALPPYCFSSSSKMMLCACAISPLSASALMTSFWSSLNWIPARLMALRFATGSLSALPSMMLALFRSPSNRVARFSAASWLLANWSPVMLVNVSSCAVASFRISSSPNSVLLCRSLAIFCSCFEVKPTLAPVDFRPASTCAMAFCCWSKAFTAVNPSAAMGAVKFIVMLLPRRLVLRPKLRILDMLLPSALSNCLVCAPIVTMRSFSFAIRRAL